MRTIIVYALSVFTVIVTVVVVIGVIVLFIDHFSYDTPYEQDFGETFSLVLKSFVALGMMAILNFIMYQNLIHL